MKQINIHNGTGFKQKWAELAINWYVDNYLPKVKKLHIDLCFNELDQFNGLCTQMDKRNFNIQIEDSLEFDDMIVTIMHEMIHVKQYVKNEMADLSCGNVRWKKCTYNPDNLDYWDHPWEKEAHNFDEILASAFMIDMDI